MGGSIQLVFFHFSPQGGATPGKQFCRFTSIAIALRQGLQDFCFSMALQLAALLEMS
jgi:hypothetical protein